MSQLWNIFNTMQLLLILPYYMVKFPGNVLAIYDIIVGIINFKVVESRTLYDLIVAPLVGKASQETPDADPAVTESLDAEGDSNPENEGSALD